MNTILSIIGKILLGLLAFLIFVFLMVWIRLYKGPDDSYRDKSVDEYFPRDSKGINRIIGSFRAALYLTYVGFFWLFMLLKVIISDKLGYKTIDN